MEPHVDPSAVLLVPCLVGVSGALLQEVVADLPIDMLLLEDVLIFDVNLPVEVLKAGSLAELHKLEGSGVSRRCAAVCDSAPEIPLTRILVLSLRSRPASSRSENVLDVREHLERNGELGLDVTIVGVCYCAGILVMLGEGASA